ncbi:hypothetical protein JVT61DRAFT_14745 [Boletus reticuloceps]|uniref:Uncharacterized protein n=1 Tax=Boletus reticuloceps TaxID=495285 RepID=A0A8I2YTA2_9AGAM|nr:hypothetical protein JVT61DRAFT_14745 [Boletus reticuloceps]
MSLSKQTNMFVYVFALLALAFTTSASPIEARTECNNGELPCCRGAPGTSVSCCPGSDHGLIQIRSFCSIVLGGLCACARLR